MQARARIRVIKADGSAEDYFHTKVLSTINNCMTQAGHFEMKMAEEFAQVITYHLFKQKIHTIRSDQILALIKEVLCSTGYEDAAESLSSRQLRRLIHRSRIEVVSDGNGSSVGQGESAGGQTSRWNKTKIADDLISNFGFERQLARTIAGAVEEKVLNLNLRQVSSKLIKQLVLAETGSMLSASNQMQSV